MSDVPYAELPLDLVDCQPQVRSEFDPEELGRLVQTLRADGVLQPIRVRRAGDRFVVVTGGRRAAAARVAGLKTIPAIIEGSDLNAGQILTRQLTENCARQDLKPMDLAVALRQLLEATGWTAAAAAQRLGLSAASVARSLSLLSLPEPIQAQVAAGKLNASSAYELSQVKDPAQQAELAVRMAAGTLTRDGARGGRRAGSTLPTAPAANRIVFPLDADRSISLTGGCPSMEQLIAWLDDLRGQARKVLPSGVAPQTFAKMCRDRVAKGGA